MIRKMMSLFVMALFLISLVPLAFAQDRENDDLDDEDSVEISRIETKDSEAMTKEEIRVRFEEKREELKERLRIQDPEKLIRLQALDNVAIDKIAGLTKDEVEKIAALSRAKQKELVGLDKAELEEKLREVRIKTVRTADDLKERALTRQKIEIAREKFESARDRYEEAKEKYQDARERYLAAKESGDEESALEHAKEILLRSADSIIGHLGKIKAKIEENEQITEERAADLAAKIDEQIAQIAAIKEKIQAASTKDEIKEVAKELRKKWNEVKHKANAFAERVVTARVEGVLHQAEVLEKKLDAALAHMEEQGIEVDVDAEVEAFSSLVVVAKESFRQAQDKLQQAIDAEDRDTVKDLTDEAKELLKDARDLLKDAHDKLKDIVEKIREAGSELEIDDDEEVEVEEIEEEEKYKEEYESNGTEVEISGEVAPSAEVKATVDGLVNSFADVEGKVELKLKVKKEDNKIEVEAEVKEGTLNDEQQALWETLQTQVRAVVEEAQGSDVELEIEIEHELEAEEETEDDEELEDEEEE